MQILKFQINFAVKVRQNMLSLVEGVILTSQPPETRVLSRHMASQSMALVDVSKLIPFSEVFACQAGDCSLDDRHELGQGRPRLLYTQRSQCSAGREGIGGSSRSRGAVVTTSLDMASGGSEADRRYRVMIMQSSRRVWV